MRTGPVILALLWTMMAGASADPSVEDAIRNLGDEDAAIREAAERTLLRAGDSVLERCRLELRNDCQPEVRARLTFVCETIEAEKAEEARWKSRWYRIERKGQPNGWMRQSAERAEHEERKTWIFTESRKWTPDIDGPLEVDEHRLVATRDHELAPRECRIRHVLPEPGWEAKATYEPTSWSLEVFSKNYKWAIPPGKPVKVEESERGEPIGIPEQLAFFVIEKRAAEDRVSLRITGDESNWFNYGECFLHFQMEMELEFAGRSYHVRKFRERPSLEKEREFWVSAEFGVVKAEGPGFLMYQLDEQAAQTKGRELPAPSGSAPGRAESAFIRFQEALKSGKGAAAWELMSAGTRANFENPEEESRFDERLRQSDAALEQEAQDRYGVSSLELRALSFHEATLRAIAKSAAGESEGLGNLARARFKDGEVRGDVLRVRVTYEGQDALEEDLRVAFSKAGEKWLYSDEALLAWSVEDSD